MNLQNLTSDQLRRAADLTEQIATLQNALAQLLNLPGDEPAKVDRRGAHMRRLMRDPARRAKMARATRRYWRNWRRQQQGRTRRFGYHPV